MSWDGEELILFWIDNVFLLCGVELIKFVFFECLVFGIDLLGVVLVDNFLGFLLGEFLGLFLIFSNFGEVLFLELFIKCLLFLKIFDSLICFCIFIFVFFSFFERENKNLLFFFMFL